jgi:hypothetical protein
MCRHLFFFLRQFDLMREKFVQCPAVAPQLARKLAPLSECMDLKLLNNDTVRVMGSAEMCSACLSGSAGRHESILVCFSWAMQTQL